MKNYDEIADSILKKYEKEIKKRNRRKLTIKKISYVISTACVFCLVFIGIKYSVSPLQQIPDINIADVTDITVTTEKNTQTQINTNNSITATSIVKTTVTGETVAVTDETAVEEITVSESEITDEISDIPETEIQPVTTEKATEISDETDIKHHESTIPSVDTGTQNAATGSDKTNDDNSETIISSPSQSLSAEKIYKEALFNNSIYTSSEKEVFSDMLDDFLDYAEMTGFNGEKKVQCTAKVYRIKEYSESIAVAVKFENSEKYYFYTIS